MNRMRQFESSAFMFFTLLLALGSLLTGCSREPERSGLSHEAAANADPPAPMYDEMNVLTYHNDNARTGEYLYEATLAPGNVNSESFGRVGFLPVQGLVDAEPLYVENLSINGKPRNVVFVATEHDLVYAFDADTFSRLWRVSVLGPGEITSDNRSCQQVTPEIGITSTPVIDLHAGPHGTIYVVAMSKDHRGRYFQRLHALDLTTGAEMHGSPRTIQAAFPGSGAGSKNGRVIFDPKQYEDRAALLLANGLIYTTWASHCDHDPYTGWVIAYSESTLEQAGVLNLTPNGTEGAIWMTGDGPAADKEGNVYLLTGNGTFDTKLSPEGFPSQGDFGNAFVKLRTSAHGLAVQDYFTMHDTVAQTEQDEDIGSGGILLLPDIKDSSGNVRHLAVGAGKDQIIYIVDRDALGKFDPASDKNYQKDIWALGGMEFASPAYFDNTVYYGAYKDSLKAFPIQRGLLPRLPASQTSKKFDYPGVTPSVSANGRSNGIVWVVENSVPATLHAYDAANLARELYNSNQAGPRDQFGHNKFIAPMIADGRVYVGTPTGVIVFGLLK